MNIWKRYRSVAFPEIAVLGAFLIAAIAAAQHDGSVHAHTNAMCGPNSLAICLKLMGREITPEELAINARTSSKGTSIHGLMTAARGVGVYVTAVESASIRSALKLGLPVIAHCNLEIGGTPDHFVLLVGQTESDVMLVDFPNQPKRIELDEFDKRFAGTALLLSSNPIRIPASSKYALYFVLLASSAAVAIVLLFCHRSGRNPVARVSPQGQVSSCPSGSEEVQ